VRRLAFVTFGIASFVSGALIGPLLAQASTPMFRADQIRGKSATEVATVLLDGALQLAETGSWERIAVGRAW